MRISELTNHKMVSDQQCNFPEKPALCMYKISEKRSRILGKAVEKAVGAVRLTASESWRCFCTDEGSCMAAVLDFALFSGLE
jgi:hypothetical protein